MEPNQSSVIVLDNGSNYLKAGFAGEAMPRVDMPMIIGRPKENDSSHQFIGFQALSNRSQVHLSCPILQGIVTNPGDLEAIWDHVFKHQLKVNPESNALLLSDFQHTVYPNRERLIEIAFERFKVPALFIMNQFTLALYSYGMVSGLSVDIGKQNTCIIPVVESQPYEQYGCQLSFGGRDVTNFLKKLLSERGYKLCHSNEHERVRQLKENCCYVAQDFDRELMAYRRHSDSYGKMLFSKRNDINLQWESIMAPEIIFGLANQSYSSMSLPDQIHNVIGRFQWDVQELLYQNIALSGGGTLFRGLPERLEKELAILAPLTTHIRIHASSARKYAVWVGGSIVGSLDHFKNMWLSREAYAENGVQRLSLNKL